MRNRKLAYTMVLVFMVIGSLSTVGPAMADEGHGYKKGTVPHSEMMEGRHMPGHHEMMEHHKSMSPLAMKEELGLNEGQVKALEPLESDYRKTSIKNHADLRIAMIDLNALLEQKTPDKNAISKKVDEIGAIQKNLMLYRVDTMLKLKDILTPTQYDQFRAEIKERMEHGWKGRTNHGSKGYEKHGEGMMEGHGKDMMKFK